MAETYQEAFLGETVPYLSWIENGSLQRFRVDMPVVLGREVASCDVVHPQDPTVSRQHAALRLGQGGGWLLVDLGSQNGTLRNGEPVGSREGVLLGDGDVLRCGDWGLTFHAGFPGLDGVNFLERVGSPFEEVSSDPAQAMRLVQGMELLHASLGALLQEGTGERLVQGILKESIKLLKADRGFIVMVEPDGSWRRASAMGEPEDGAGLSHTILDYVASHRTAILSNIPLADPRFQASSVASRHRGALMAAPMMLDDTVLGMLYLDRLEAGQPFIRFDLALFQAFVHLGALALRQSQLSHQALHQAESHGELVRVRGKLEDLRRTSRGLLQDLLSAIRWLEIHSTRQAAEVASPMSHQAEHLRFVVEAALQDLSEDAPPRETSGTIALALLQEHVGKAWQSLAAELNFQIELTTPPEGVVWVPPQLCQHALLGLVEPMLCRVGADQVLHGRWSEDGNRWLFHLSFPPKTLAPTPESWTAQAMKDAGIHWRFGESRLTVSFPRGLDTTPEVPTLPLLGLVCQDPDTIGLFERVAEAGGCLLHPLEEEPPPTQLPKFRYLVVDALERPGVADLIRAYRRHPGFASVPILVVHTPEALVPDLLAAGTTDWLPEGFRWETLFHRLQALRGHEELQRKALSAERLDSFKQMAGTLKHEINNPLAVISMQVELLERKYPEEPKLQKIGEMVERIRGLVQVLQKMRETTTEDYPGGSSIMRVGS